MVKLDHLTLAVRDWRVSRDWYVANFGFGVEFEIADGGGAGAGVAALQDDAGFTLFLEQVPPPIFSGQGACALQVDDVDQLCARLHAAGVDVAAAPGKQFWGYGAVVCDPDGHRFHIWDQVSMATRG
jgi:catechol 2,3-dioxygenase-like lactoylglutathione lyase family enzyme